MSTSHHEDYKKTLLGFWLYLITDFMLFGSLFATYIVLQGNLFGGPGAKELFSLNTATVQSIIFLIIAFTSGLASHFAHKNQKKITLICLILTFILAAIFLTRLFQEFLSITHLGYSWRLSGFLSAYYSLNGMFAFHVLFGLIWTILCLLLISKRDFNPVSLKRISCLKMFWQFLNVIWIFIYSIVYVLGVF